MSLDTSGLFCRQRAQRASGATNIFKMKFALRAQADRMSALAYSYLRQRPRVANDPTLANTGREADVAGIVWRSLTQGCGKAPTNISDTPVVAGRSAAGRT